MSVFRSLCNRIREICDEGIAAIGKYNDYLEKVSDKLSFIEDKIDDYLRGERSFIDYDGQRIDSFYEDSKEEIQHILYEREIYAVQKKKVDDKLETCFNQINALNSNRSVEEFTEEYYKLNYNIQRYHDSIDKRLESIISQMYANENIYDDVKHLVSLQEELEMM